MSNTMKQCLNCKPGEIINKGYDQFPEGKEFYDFYIDMIDPNEEQQLNDVIPHILWKDDLKNGICPFCKNRLVDTLILPDDCHAIAECSNYNRELLIAMIKLRKIDVIEYEVKMQVFRKQMEETENMNVPRCPTCNSTNVGQILYKKKAFSVLLFGLYSSNVRNTMQCHNCGYKW